MDILLGEVWLTYADLQNVGVPLDTIKTGVKRKSKVWQAIKSPNDGRVKLIRYGTLRSDIKEAVRLELCGGLEPDEWLIMQEEIAKQAEKHGNKACLLDKVEDVCKQGYKRYNHLYKDATERQIRCLGRAAGIVEVLAAWYKANDIKWKDYEPVKQVAEWVDKNADEYFYLKYLPSNPIRLKEKVIAFGVEGKALNEVICLPRSGNDNRVKHKSEMWWQSTAVSLRISGRNFTKSQIFRKIALFATQLDCEIPSETTVRNLLKETETLTARKHMDLNNRHLHRHRASMPILRAMAPDDCWEMDGSRVQLQPHKTADGLKFLNVTIVRDVYSGAVLGWHFAHAESGHGYRMALKMAVSITGKLPYELRYDRFPGHNTPEWEYLFEQLEKYGVKLTKTSTASGKASTERQFKTLQQVFEGESLAYWGQGIRDSTAAAHPTEAYRHRVGKELRAGKWDFEAAWMEECAVLSRYNNTSYAAYSRKYKGLDVSPWDMYQAASSESTGYRVEIWDVAELFWATRKVGVRNRKIVISSGSNSVTYDLLDHYEIIRHYQTKDTQLLARFEPHDMSEIMVFTLEGKYLDRVAAHGGFQLYGPNAEWNKAAKWKQKNKEVDERLESELNDYLDKLPAEAAAMMPMTVGKHAYEDAQSIWTLENSGEWQRPGKQVSKEPESKPVYIDDNFDADEFARVQL